MVCYLQNHFVIRTILVLFLTLSLTGCIAANRIRIDSAALPAPDFDAACDYDWPDVISEFRSPIATGINNPGWAYYSQGAAWYEHDEEKLGQWFTDMIAEDLSFCSRNNTDPTTVELTIYYASYELPINPTRAVFDLVTLLSTLGTIPMDESEGYMMCLEVRSQGTVLQHAFVTGLIKVDMNMWGMGSQENKGHASVTEMMHALGETVWRSIWSEPAPEGTQEADCMAELDASGLMLPKLISREQHLARSKGSENQ